MKKIFTLVILSFIYRQSFSQVGINTTTPKAQLEIKSSNQVAPANTDGILIPKIDAFPTTNPTIEQQGMMVYLTTTFSGNTPGFYFWDNSVTAWKPIGSSQWVTNDIHISNNNVGNVGIGTGAATPYSLLTVKEGGIGFTQEDNSGVSKIGFYTIPSAAYIQTHSNTDMSFATNNGISQMVLQKGTGNLGIGFNNPTEKLDVNGKTKTTNLQVTNGAAAGRILTSDAVGNASWTVAPSANLLYFDENRITTFPNTTRPAHQLIPSGTENNIDFVITPKGEGAITAQVANNAVSGGEKRGVDALDLQVTRLGANQVASGYNSAILGGTGNTSSGDFSASFGSYSRATATGSIAFGYSCDATGFYSTAFGYDAVASGSFSVATGLTTIASGDNATVLGYLSNASGKYSISFGTGITAQSMYETALGVYGTTGTGNPTAYINGNRLLNVGNGQNSSSRSDAFTILKDGLTGFSDSTPTSTVDINGTFATACYVGNTGTIPLSSRYSIYIYTSGTNFISLPAPSFCPNRRYTIVNKKTTGLEISTYQNLVNIGVFTIDSGKYIEIVSDGTNWQQIAGN